MVRCSVFPTLDGLLISPKHAKRLASRCQGTSGPIPTWAPQILVEKGFEKMVFRCTQGWEQVFHERIMTVMSALHMQVFIMFEPIAEVYASSEPRAELRMSFMTVL